MKIVSWNVNGLRSVYRKGFLDWFQKADVEILCLQEIKAREEQLASDLIKPKGYYSIFNSAQRKGYGGVAVYSREKPLLVKRELGMSRFDEEGRVLELKYPNFTLINFYLPHGGRQKNNLDYKLEVYDCLLKKLAASKDDRAILLGDFNVAHEEIDLARPKQNHNNIMFTPDERKQISKLIKLGFIDSFRKFNKENGNHTWWPYSYDARKRNLGWRLDYVFTSDKLTPKLKDAFIMTDVQGSDHCPIGIELFSC